MFTIVFCLKDFIWIVFSRIILWRVNLDLQRIISLARAGLLKDPHMVCITLPLVYGYVLN